MATATPPMEPTPPEAPPATGPSPLSSMGSVTWAGLIIIYMSVASFLGVGYLLYETRGLARLDLSRYAPEFILCAVGVFTALLGVKLVRAGGVAPSDPLPVVNKQEWGILAHAIQANRDDPIGAYVKLSSLTGATGFFTKLGLSGLPLATIGLTLFFALTALLAPLADVRSEFSELTQLTLGAFIGSFVQRQLTAVRETAAADARGPQGPRGAEVRGAPPPAPAPAPAPAPTPPAR